MKVETCELAGVLLIEPRIFGDARGWFLETWNDDRYHEAGLADRFVQDNLSYSRRGTLRGLHFQNPNPQGKLVTVLQGEVMDVVVDLRRSSSTFRRWQGFRLDGVAKRQVYVPPGFAHGFLVLSEEVWFHYKCTAAYSPKDEGSLSWNDPDLAIPWPIAEPILSAKDAAAPRLCDIPPNKLFA